MRIRKGARAVTKAWQEWGLAARLEIVQRERFDGKLLTEEGRIVGVLLGRRPRSPSLLVCPNQPELTASAPGSSASNAPASSMTRSFAELAAAVWIAA